MKLNLIYKPTGSVFDTYEADREMTVDEILDAKEYEIDEEGYLLQVGFLNTMTLPSELRAEIAN